MRKNRIIPLVVFAVAMSGCGGSGSDPSHEIAIAAAGPMTGAAADRGKELDRAVRMAVDETNNAGGVNGRRIRVTVYDDGDQPDRAREVARQIAAGPAVAVLGQVASSAAVAAGEVYRSEKIPAITGAASEARVTRGNDWFFRMLRDAEGQGDLLAEYARYRYGIREVAILREKGTAGEEFAAAFRDRAKSERIRIAADLEFLPKQATDSVCLDDLSKKLSKLPKGTFLVLGTQYAETAPVLKGLRDRLGPFTGMGYSSVATDNLSNQLAKFETDRHAPGYYTEGFIVAAPQLADVAGYTQMNFSSRYKERYGVDPTPEAVRWYESAQLVFQALRAEGISGGDRALVRRQIREWLGSRDRPEAAAAGTAGPIWFDKDHNVVRGISIGVFYNGKLISAPVQFIPVSDPDQVPGWERLNRDGLVIDDGGAKIVKTPVVFAGIDLNSLDNIDVRNGTFAADFFLWLRRLDDSSFDVHEVEFPTAVSGALLGKEVWTRGLDGSTTSTYHVKGVFRADYEFARYPFDQQILRIPIQVRNSTSYTLILAYGGAGTRKVQNSASILASKLWILQKELFFRDAVSYQSESFGKGAQASLAGVEYNRVNAALTIKRDVFGFAVKNFLPLLCILVAVVIGYMLAPDVVNPRISIGVTALLTTSVLYQKLASDLPSVTYIIGMDYVFFAFFGFCVLFLTLSVITYETQKYKKVELTNALNRGGAVLTFVALIGTIAFVWIRFWGRQAA